MRLNYRMLPIFGLLICQPVFAATPSTTDVLSAVRTLQAIRPLTRAAVEKASGHKFELENMRGPSVNDWVSTAASKGKNGFETIELVEMKKPTPKNGGFMVMYLTDNCTMTPEELKKAFGKPDKEFYHGGILGLQGGGVPDSMRGLLIKYVKPTAVVQFVFFGAVQKRHLNQIIINEEEGGGL